FNSSDYAKLEKNKADMQKMMDILKILDKLVINELADSNALNMNNTDDPHDAWTNESSGVVEKWEDIICIIETINRMIPGNTGRMNGIIRNMKRDKCKIDGYSNKYLYELIDMMNKMINDAEGLKGEEYKEVYDQIAIICNEIKKKICMYLIKRIRMLDPANLIFHEIDKTVVIKYNERFKELKRNNKSISYQIKIFDKMLNEMKPAQLKKIMYTVVKSVCKKHINKDYRLSKEEGEKNVEEAIKALPHLGAIINNSGSNALNSGVEKNYSVKNALVLLILFMLTLTYKDMIDQEMMKDLINQKMDDSSKPIAAVEINQRKMMIESSA
ncbi:hypothetical protein HK407_08g13550, partial [Ordospora pajunii]|uniref:uncharacterized protein n=1 Tax=Ordospora pajunii TaxID=3039483 RepID=UPI0029528160